MDPEKVKKIKAFTNKNPYPSYEFMEDFILDKARKWHDRGDVEFKMYYFMMHSEYGYTNHKLLKEIYENIEDTEIIKKNGEQIDGLGGIQTMEYNARAFHEGLIYLMNEKARTKFEKQDMVSVMKLQLQEGWDGVGEWVFMP